MGTPKHGRAVVRRAPHAARIEAPEVTQLAAAPEGAEQAEHQAVHVEERERVGQAVLAGPPPRVGERVEVGGDGPAREDGALGGPRRARGVDDERGVLVVEVVRWELAAALVDVDPQLARAVQRGRGLGRRADEDLGGAVREDVATLILPEPRIHRHERDAGGDRAHDGDAGLEARLRPHRGALDPAQPAGDGGGRLAEFAVGERSAFDPQRGSRVQLMDRWQQSARHPVLPFRTASGPTTGPISRPGHPKPGGAGRPAQRGRPAVSAPARRRGRRGARPARPARRAVRAAPRARPSASPWRAAPARR